MIPKIAVIGEFCDIDPHTALNRVLDDLKTVREFDYEWVDTLRVEQEKDRLLGQYAGIWSAPGSPFKSLDGALTAVAWARENDIPHLGTCAGFQHAVLDIARNLLGIRDAQHEEYDAGASTLFVSRLACSLAGKTMAVSLTPGSLSQFLYGRDRTEEDYYCNFAINPQFRDRLDHPRIRIAGTDQDDEIRIIELPDNRFFVLTLFVPQTRSAPGAPHPLIRGFLDAVCS